MIDLETQPTDGSSLDKETRLFRILSLDGGGSKGIYALGVLKEFEALIQQPLAKHFDLMYGTSTGAIIIALLALGLSIAAIEEKYLELVPSVMTRKTSWARTSELRKRLNDTFGNQRFDAFQTAVGIVATNYDRERPMIFKTSVLQAFKGKATFLPGFGVTIADALMASTAAFPFFRRMHLETKNAGSPEVMDGGYVANNPTLFAVADAMESLGAVRSRIRIMSVGVGHYSEPQRRWYSRVIFSLFPFKMMEKEFVINTNTIEILRKIFFSDISCVRIDTSHPDRQYTTDLLEADLGKLKKLCGLGRDAFHEHEAEVANYLAI